MGGLRSVGTAGLVAKGWPGERMLPAAARNRLHVTLTTLRKLGLRELLQANEGGYLLDPALPVRLVDAEAGEVA